MEINKEPKYVVFATIDNDDLECVQNFPKTEEGLNLAIEEFKKVAHAMKRDDSEYTSLEICIKENGCYRFDKRVIEYIKGDPMDIDEACRALTEPKEHMREKEYE